MMRRVLPVHPPVSLLGSTFVRDGIINFGQEWADQAGISLGYGQHAHHPFHCPTRENLLFSSSRLNPV